MGVNLVATVSDEADFPYRCASCGFEDRVRVHTMSSAKVDITFGGRDHAGPALAELAHMQARASISEAFATAACPKCAQRDRRAVIAAFMRRIWFGMGVALPATIAGLAVAGSMDANPLYGMVLAFLIVWPIAWFVRYRVAQRAMDRDVTFLSLT
jgi:hypothetical protein